MSEQPPDVHDLPEPPPPSEQSTAGDEPRAKSQGASTRLVKLALSGYTLGRTAEGDAFATPSSGPMQHVTLPLRGHSSFRTALARDYYQAEGKVPPQAALAEALIVLEGEAAKLPTTTVHLRVGEAQGAHWIDMGDETGRVVELRPGRWSVVQHSAALFERTRATAALPMPEAGGSLDELWEFVNVAPEDRALLVGVLVMAWLWPDVPHVAPTFTGEQGTGKSTAGRLLVDLLDPSAAPLRRPPTNADTFVNGALGSWVVAYDNLSAVPVWLSDSLCRAITGEAELRRALYTDKELALVRFHRQVILTGIDFAGLAGDLAERLLTIELHRIPDAARLDERTMRARWETARPRIVGALLDLAAAVLERVQHVTVKTGPRMADYMRVLTALDDLHGTSATATYLAKGAALAADTLTASPFVEMLMQQPRDFHGTASDLLEVVADPDPEWRKPKGWPEARGVTTQLRRNAPALRKNGWTVDDLGSGGANHTTTWHVVSPGRDCRGH